MNSHEFAGTRIDVLPADSARIRAIPPSWICGPGNASRWLQAPLGAPGVRWLGSRLRPTHDSARRWLQSAAVGAGRERFRAQTTGRRIR
jgi:hypothetical protein